MSGLDSKRAHFDKDSQREATRRRVELHRWRKDYYKNGYRCLRRVISNETVTLLAKKFPYIAAAQDDDKELEMRLDALDAALAQDKLGLWCKSEGEK